MFKLSEYNLTPGHILVLPQLEDYSDSVLQVSAVNKELSIGDVVLHDSMKFASYVQSIPDGLLPKGPISVSYKRAASQSIKLADEEGDECEYRVIHEDDITGWFTSTEIKA